MKYYWKIVMTSGVEYVVENKVDNVGDFIYYVFGNGSKPVLSGHDLRDGGLIMIHSSAVASIVYNGVM